MVWHFVAPWNFSRTTPAAVNDAINFNYLVSLEEKGKKGMLVTCRDCGVGERGRGADGSSWFCERAVFFFLSMALEAFTLDRGALPF